MIELIKVAYFIMQNACYKSFVFLSTVLHSVQGPLEKYQDLYTHTRNH